MKLSQYMVIITHLMALLGLLAVTLVGGVSPLFIGFMAIGIALSLVLRSWEKSIIPRGLWNLIAIAIFFVFLADFLWGGRDLTASAARFLTLLLTAKLYDLRKNRDYVIIYCTVFFQILAAAASTVSPLFLPVLLLFIIGSIFAMITVNIQKEFELGMNSGVEPPRGIFDLSFSAYAVTLSTVTISMTFFLFMLLPRMEAGFFQKKNQEAIKVVGFSDTVDLGALGPVKRDPTVIMRVDFPGMKKRPQGPLYFRGGTLSVYDGSAWRRGARRERLVKKRYDEFYLAARPRGKVFEERVLLEPMNSTVLFSIPRAVRISGKFKNLWTDSTGAVYLPSPALSRLEYRVWSSPAAIRPAESTDMSRYVDLSKMDKTLLKRIKSLAMKITAGGRDNVEKSAIIKRYLRANYTYTLDPKRDPKKSPVEDFLFYSKEGFCEHFATAFALLSRSIGIPTRIVTGFLEGEWNRAGKYFIVRQSDAHSWAEVYAGGSAGWVRADPTPPEGLSPLMRGTSLSNYLDYLHLKWNRYVVNYTTSDQRRIAFTFNETGRRLVNSLDKGLRGLGAYTEEKRQFLIVLLFVLLTALFLVRIREKKSRILSRKTPDFYLDMLRILKRKGLEKHDSETAMEFAQRVRRPGVREITEIYQKVRFGKEQCGTSEYSRIREIIRGLRAGKDEDR